MRFGIRQEKNRKNELINEVIRLSSKPCLSLLARKVQANINLKDLIQDTKPFINQPGFNPKSFYDYFASLLELDDLYE